TIDLPGDLPHLIGDPARIRQVLTNLVANAVKFTEAGEVSIRVVSEPSPDLFFFRIEVSDTGIGIPVERHASIFESFTQADASTTRRFGGTGLGLAICRRLMDLMGGEIGVRSKEAAGSTFWIGLSLPVTASPSARMPAEVDWMSELSVLIVDDNETNRRILGRMLAGWGVESAECDSGVAACELLAKKDCAFDFILLDYLMPDLDGIGTADKIHDICGPSGPKIIILSSAADMRPSKDWKNSGITAWLMKPVRMSHLWSVLNGFAAVSAPPRNEEATQDADPRIAGLSILLAEDNDVNVRVAMRLLEKLGCEVVHAWNGMEALSCLAHRSFDVVLMDVHMPVMDGLEATRQIRLSEIGTDNRQRIVALTAKALTRDVEECLAAGMDDYLSKPLRPGDLHDKIVKVMTPVAPV
ncbi:MAG: response regulator, partial [Fimbriimonas sp.]